MLGRLLLLVIALAVFAAVFLAGRFVVDKVTRRDTSDRPPPWRDLNVLSLAAQVLALGLIVTVGSWLWSNFRDRTDDIGLELTFGFLDQPSGISIAGNPLSSNAGIRDALQQGVKNTFLIILLGIPLSVLFGTLIGIARLSTNWLVRKLATGYVEFFRNIPPLLVIVFLWGAIFLNFPIGASPTAEAAWRPFGGWMIFSNSRFAFPSIVGLDNFGAYRLLVVGSVVAAVGVWAWRTRVFNNTGAPHRQGAVVLGDLGRAVWSVLLGAGRAVRVLQDHRRGSDLVGWLSDANALCGGDVGACHLHGLPYRRDCSGQHPGRTQGASGGLPCSGPEWFATVPVRDTASGLPDCLPTVDQPVPQLHQELFIGRGDRFR